MSPGRRISLLVKAKSWTPWASILSVCMYLFLYLSTCLFHLFSNLFIHRLSCFISSYSFIPLPILLILSPILLSTHPIHPSSHTFINLSTHSSISICSFVRLFFYFLIHLSIPSFVFIPHLSIHPSHPHVLLTCAKQILYHVLRQPYPKEL